MTLEQMVKTADLILGQIEKLREDVKCIDAEIVKKFCTIKAGDICVINDWTYKGKNMLVSQVHVSRNYEIPVFIVRGYILRKNGIMSGNQGSSYYHLNMEPYR